MVMACPLYLARKIVCGLKEEVIMKLSFQAKHSLKNVLTPLAGVLFFLSGAGVCRWQQNLATPDHPATMWFYGEFFPIYIGLSCFMLVVSVLNFMHFLKLLRERPG